MDGKIVCRNIKDNFKIGIEFEGNTKSSAILCLKINNKKDLLLTGHNDGQIYVWDIKLKKLKYSL